MMRTARHTCAVLMWLLLLGAASNAPAAESSNATTNPPPAAATQAGVGMTPGENFSAKVLAAALGGFLAWMLTKATGYWVLRQRFLHYMVVVVNAHLRQYQDLDQWLRAVREKTIKDGHIVKLAAKYTVDKLEDLTAVRPDALRLLTQDEIVKITLLLHRLTELEALVDGFCAMLVEYQSAGTPLTPPDVDYLRLKQDRIFSYMHLVPKAVESIAALPAEYPGIIGADSLVTGNSAVRAPQEVPSAVKTDGGSAAIQQGVQAHRDSLAGGLPPKA